MVHLLHHEAMQIDKVAADVQFGDLPSAIREGRIASREAAGEQSAMLRPRASRTMSVPAATRCSGPSTSRSAAASSGVRASLRLSFSIRPYKITPLARNVSAV